MYITIASGRYIPITLCNNNDLVREEVFKQGYEVNVDRAVKLHNHSSNKNMQLSLLLRLDESKKR